MVNTSVMKYNVTSANSYGEMFTQVNGFVGGTVGHSIILVFWVIAFFTLQSYPNLDAFKASTWSAWLLSVFMTLLKVVNPAFSLFLFIVVLAATAYSSQARR